MTLYCWDSGDGAGDSLDVLFQALGHSREHCFCHSTLQTVATSVYYDSKSLY